MSEISNQNDQAELDSKVGGTSEELIHDLVGFLELSQIQIGTVT